MGDKPAVHSTRVHTYIQVHTYINTHIHTCTYTHTHTHTQIYTQLLDEELKGSVHALSLVTKTPEEVDA